MNENVKIKADNHSDLDAISTILQDSIFHPFCCSFHKQHNKCVRFLLNRFCWENENRDNLGHNRVQSAMYVHHVNNIFVNDIFKNHKRHHYLNLLSIHSTKDNEIIFMFSDKKYMKIYVNRISVYLKDIQNKWPTHLIPKHDFPKKNYCED